MSGLLAILDISGDSAFETVERMARAAPYRGACDVAHAGGAVLATQSRDWAAAHSRTGRFGDTFGGAACIGISDGAVMMRPRVVLTSVVS